MDSKAIGTNFIVSYQTNVNGTVGLLSSTNGFCHRGMSVKHRLQI